MILGTVDFKDLDGLMLGGGASAASPSMKQRVYQALKADLLAGRLRPGAFLQEKEVAVRFGCSKTPIREALGDLVNERLIQLIPRKGYWVTPIEPNEALETIELRIILECAGVGMAAKRITQAELERLEDLIRPDPTAPQLTARELAELNSRTNILFHQRIAAASGNRPLLDALTKVLESLSRAIFFNYYTFATIEEMSGDHAIIVDALRRRDADEAQLVIKRHIEATRLRLMDALLGNTGVQADARDRQS